MEFIFSVRDSLLGLQSGLLLYTNMCSASLTMPLESFRAE